MTVLDSHLSKCLRPGPPQTINRTIPLNRTNSTVTSSGRQSSPAVTPRNSNTAMVPNKKSPRAISTHASSGDTLRDKSEFATTVGSPESNLNSSNGTSKSNTPRVSKTSTPRTSPRQDVSSSPATSTSNSNKNNKGPSHTNSRTCSRSYNHSHSSHSKLQHDEPSSLQLAIKHALLSSPSHPSSSRKLRPSTSEDGIKTSNFTVEIPDVYSKSAASSPFPSQSKSAAKGARPPQVPTQPQSCNVLGSPCSQQPMNTSESLSIRLSVTDSGCGISKVQN